MPTKRNLVPWLDRLVVKQIEGGGVSEGGVILPEQAKEKPQRGEVVAVGEGPRGENGEPVAMGFVAGDEVIFSKYGGTEFSLDGEDYLILREADVLAVVR